MWEGVQMSKRNETLKKRYQVYRRLGYNSKTASALSHRALDVSSLEISDKTGKLKRNSTTKKFFDSGIKEWENKRAIDNYTGRMSIVKNDTVHTRHGMMTQDPRYKGETGKIVSIIKNENKLSTDQAYYFYYVMNQSGMTYKQTQTQLLSNKEFEEYDARKKQRVSTKKNNKYKRFN